MLTACLGFFNDNDNVIFLKKKMCFTEKKQTREPSGSKDNKSDAIDIEVLVVVYVAGVLVSVATVVIVAACVILFKR